MPSPKDIKNVLKTTQGTKAGKAMDLEELLGTLPKGTKAQQLEAELMFKRLEEERAALTPKAKPATTTGNTAIDDAKKTLAKKKPVLQKFDPKAELQRQALEAELEASAPKKIVLSTASSPNKKKQFIEDVYSQYASHPFMPQQRVITEGEGDAQKFAQFELKPGFGKDEVEIDWISAYPNRSGMGTKAIRELQQRAQDAGINLTVYPWDKGNVSQRALTAFYKKLGFQNLPGKSKTMVWRPEAAESVEAAAPAVIIPSKISNVEKAVRESRGEFGGKRVQRAADKIKNLEDQYTEEALRRAFAGDNTNLLMIGNPAEFKNFAAELTAPYRPGIEKYLWEMSNKNTRPSEIPLEARRQGNVVWEGGATDVPFLELNQKEGKLPFVSGHEGRHRNLAMEELGYPSTLWRMMPRAALREDFPRRDPEEYLNALIEHLGTREPLVIPEGKDWADAINLPELFAEGGGVHMAGGGKALKVLKGADKAADATQDIQSIVSAGKPLTAAERQLVAEMAARQGEELVRLRSADLGSVATKGKSKGPSPKPARAKPKTKAEISAIAERVAPQMTGEFVRPDPKKSTNPAGKSRKQFDLEQELEHDMQRSREVPEAEIVDLEPHMGSVMLSLPGDISISDMDVFGVGGEGLRMPSRQYGGPRFGLAHPEEAGWASGLVPASGFQRRVTGASQQYGDVPVLANFMAMGPEGLNYAQHYADALLKSTRPEQMTQRNIDHFNKMIRSGTAKHDFPDFPGIENPDAAYLYFAENPEARKHYNSVMQLTDTTKALGLPSGLNVRHAISTPELRDMERGMTGYSLMQMEPGVMGLKPSAHPTYSHDIPGQFLGRTDVLMPYELTFPDTVAGIRANPKQAGSEFGTLQFSGGKQIIDQQLLDEIGEYRRRIKELTGKKDGGVVHMAGGNEPGESIGEMFKPKPLTIPSPLTDMVDAVRRQFGKEKRSMSKPGAATDVLLRGPVAFAAGTPMDLIGMGGEALDYLQTKIPGLRKNASVMDQQRSVVDKRQPEMGYAPKVQVSPQGMMPYGTEHFQEKLNQSGLTTGEERPLFELGSAIVAPGAAQKALKYGKALAPTAADMLETQLLRATDPMRMNIVPEGGTVGGKLKAPANEVGFYNPAEKAALNVQRKKGQGSAFVSDLKKTPGVNDERLAELGLGDLASRPNVTREEVLAAAEQNRIPLREVVSRERDAAAINKLEEEYESLAQQFEAVSGQGNPEEVMRISAAVDKNLAEQNRIKSLPEARFSPTTSPDYSLPGGQNYREIRVALPAVEKPQYFIAYKDGSTMGAGFASKADAEAELADLFGSRPDLEIRQGSGSRSMTARNEENFYNSTHHGDEPNVLFHLRVADHVDAEGKKGLLIDELQSDWHQKGRDKGYGNKLRFGYSIVEQEPGFFSLQKEGMSMPMAYGTKDHVMDRANYYNAFEKGVPDAPFKDNWYQLGIKRAIKEAADSGMERVYLTTGARQADRYDLSKRVSYIDYRKSPVYNKYELGIADIHGDAIDLPKAMYTAEELPDIVGKEVADKIIKGEGESGGGRKTLRGLDLKIGGEGMKQYYDKTYKNYLDKYAKQFGGKVGETKLRIGLQQDNWPSFRDWFELHYPNGVNGRFANDFWTQGGSNKYLREFRNTLEDELERVYYIDITPKMRESAAKGQSYKDGGAVNMAEGGQLTFARANQLLQKHVANMANGGAVRMAEGGAVDYESRFNEMLQKHVQGMAEGGEVNTYDSDPDVTDGGQFVQAPAFADGGAVKSIWTVN